MRSPVTEKHSGRHRKIGPVLTPSLKIENARLFSTVDRNAPVGSDCIPHQPPPRDEKLRTLHITPPVLAVDGFATALPFEISALRKISG